MTTSTKQVALEQFNRISAGDITGAAAVMAEDLLNHAAIPEAQGRKGFVAIQEKLRTAFPDLQYKLEDCVVDGDKAVLRMTMTGTQTGPFNMARLQLAPTGKAVNFEQIHILRVSGGKVVEHWMGQDPLAFIRQLGLQVTQA